MRGIATVLASGLVLLGCTQEYRMVPGAGLQRTMNQAFIPGIGPVNVGPQSTPGSQQASAQPSATPVSRDGTFAGRADVLNTMGVSCPFTRQITDLVVSGNQVRWGRFRGTIDSNGGITMNHAGTWMFGQFEGDQLAGTLLLPNFCSYRFALDRAA
jgi:hypothetical protein